MSRTFRRAAAAVLFSALAGHAVAQSCPPAQAPRELLRSLAAAQWRLADEAAREPLALALLPCLASSDPELRDAAALSALHTWMQRGELSVAAARQIADHSLAALSAPDADGFAAPTAALVLADVVRADRQQPLWSKAEREQVLAAATGFLARTRDYRGFDPAQGWRDPVRAGADLLMELAMNEQFDRPQLDRILDAVAAQTTPAEHFYIFGEGERLARPVIFVARRKLHAEGEWTSWLGRIALAGAPDPSSPTRIAALARQHNAKQFLLPLYAALQEGGDADMRARLLPGLTAALRTLP